MKWISYVLISILAACTTEPKKQESASLHLELANSYIQKENYPMALKELLVAQDLDPGNEIVQSYLGFVYFTRDRFDLAEEHYKKAIFIKPDFTDAKNNLARIYIETSQNKLAEKLLLEVLTDYTYTDFPRAYLNYGILEFNRKNYKKALTYLEKNIEKERENCITHVYMGRSYLELSENDRAVTQLNKAIHFCEMAQTDEAYYYNAIALFRNNQKDLAKIRFEELLKIYPTGKNADRAKRMLDVIKKGNL